MKRRLRKKLFTQVVVKYENGNGNLPKVKKQPRRIQRAVFRTLLNNINYPNRYEWERKLKERLWSALG